MPHGATTFAAAPENLVITQSANDVTLQIGATKEVFTLDDKITEAPAGDVNALKTRRRCCAISKTGGQSTTRTMTYMKAQ